MATLLSKQQLESELEEFRDILANFDYSSIKNITFLNLESFIAYMDNVNPNPFKEQYAKLQEKLDILQPYLPFATAERANEFLDALSHSHGEYETQRIKRRYTKILRDDFIKFARTVTTNEEWERTMEVCEEIRLRKEELLYASH